MKIACEHPQLIFNPNLRWLVSCKCPYAVLGPHEVGYTSFNRWNNFPWKDFYAARENVTPETIDDYYLVDMDGLTYPVFMYVPCGKCRLCRKHYVDDWCTRCMCESASSDFPPLFITLTYRPEDRPESADDCKRDFQLFMKRLRINVSRHLNIQDHELRYFARSERTPKNKYWHIHFMLWNMPFVSVREGDRNSFQSLIRFIQEDCWSHGITRVERCRDNSGSYVLKYALKDDNPEYWQLASRRNGIGNKFAMQLLPTVLQNPDMMSFSVPDGSGHSVVRRIPSYFKRIWFPTLSVLFPADVCKAAKDFMDCACTLHYAMQHMTLGNRCSDIVEMVSDVAQKYRIMHIDFDDAYPHRRVKLEIDQYYRVKDAVGASIPLDFRHDVVYPVVKDGVLVPFHNCVYTGSDMFWCPTRLSQATLSTSTAFDFRFRLITQWSLFKRSYAILMNYDFDEGEFIRRLSITSQHQEYVRAMVDQLPEVDVDALLNQVEIDDAWIETHWMQSEIG